MLKKVFALIISTAICLSLLSGCGESAVGEAQTEETTTVQTLSEEELDKMVQNMPEIVFVMSHHYFYYAGADINTNILGFYITNTGKIKMFDFRKIAPDEIYEIPDVYDRLKEATCSEIAPKIYWSESSYEEELITEDKLSSLSEEELIGYYKRLLLIDGNVEYVKCVATMNIGHYRVYGIKNNDNGERECVLLGGYATDYNSKHSDPNADELCLDILRLFPELPEYNG